MFKFFFFKIRPRLGQQSQRTVHVIIAPFSSSTLQNETTKTWAPTREDWVKTSLDL